MKYMLFICGDEAITISPEEGREMGEATESWVDSTTSRGIRLQGDRLAGPGDATTVRVRDGEMLVADGPFAETKEFIAGFDIIECANLDEAIEVAAAHPVSRFGAVEVRPYWQP
ncbi:MAG TPA: YciI family protein [Streptosporangiaceae bacterium]|nr:YciI family protein [Streptosporangiaceae bacterium]